MRLKTLASAAILAASSAAIAQVATTPIEQKGDAATPAANDTTTDTGSLANVTENLTAEPAANATETAAPAAGDPATSTDAPRK